MFWVTWLLKIMTLKKLVFLLSCDFSIVKVLVLKSYKLQSPQTLKNIKLVLLVLTMSLKRLAESGFAMFLILMTYQNSVLPPPPFILYPSLKIVLFQMKWTDLLDHKGRFTGARTLDDCKHDLTENIGAVWFLSTEIWYFCGKHKKKTFRK